MIVTKGKIKANKKPERRDGGDVRVGVFWGNT